MAEIKFADKEIKHILEPINKTKARNYINNTFVGTSGSNDLEYISSDGRIITFTSIVDTGDTGTLEDYRNLEKTYTNKAGVLVGSSDLSVNGNYYLTEYKEEKEVTGAYKIDWEFTEYIKPNIVQKTFKRIGKSATKKKSTKTKAKKTSKKKTEIEELLVS